MAVIRRHWWLLVRPALAVVALLLMLPLYALVDYYAPAAGLARYTAAFLWLDLGLCTILGIKWLVVDLASWLADVYVITSRRLIEQRGLLMIERREATLRTVQESNYSISGPQARLLNFGDLTVQTGGRGSGMVFRAVSHPRRLQHLISMQAREAREAYRQLNSDRNEINDALGRIFGDGGGVHDAATQAVPRITRAALQMQRRLSLLADETVIFATRRHAVTLVAGLIAPVLFWVAVPAAIHLLGVHPPTVVLLLYLAAAILWPLWEILDWLDDRYVLTTERIIEVQRTPLLSELRAVVQLRAVKDVVLRISSVSGRVFNMGTLTVELGTEPLALRAVPHPDRLQRMIFQQIDEAVQRDRLREQERLAGTLSEWFQEYHKMQGDAASGASP